MNMNTDMNMNMNWSLSMNLNMNRNMNMEMNRNINLVHDTYQCLIRIDATAVTCKF